MNKISLIFILVCLGQTYSVLNPKVVCYYDYWLVWRTGNDKFSEDNLDTSLCTHIVYSDLQIDTKGELVSKDSAFVLGAGHDLTKFADSKGTSKALVSVEGGNMALVVSNTSTRADFVNNVYKFLETYRLDGLVIEFTNEFSDNYVTLLQQLHVQFGTKFILGIGVGGTPGAFQPKEVNNYVDFYNIGTYDYHGPWTSEFGHHVGHEAPLKLVLDSLEEWEKKGAEKSKLLMTVPLFARTWILAGSDTAPGALATGPGKADSFTQVDGKLGYIELCLQMEAAPHDWVVHTDAEEDAMYAVNTRTNTWVSFESTVTAKAKTNRITALGYGGVVALTLDNDDYQNLCKQNKYPLMHSIIDGLDKNPPTPTPTTTPSTIPHWTPDPKDICQKTGVVRDPKDCNIYHDCREFMPGQISDVVKHCPDGYGFDETEMKCKDKSLVAGC